MSARLRGLLPLLPALILGGCGGGDTAGPDEPSGPPVVTSINGATQPSGPAGSTVIIEGSNFGSAQGTSQVLFSDAAGGSLAATIASPADWTSTFIVTTIPSGAATGNVIVQTQLGSSAPLTFTITQNATFSPSTIGWSATTDLPAAVSGHGLAFAQLGSQAPVRFLYAIGGTDNSNALTANVHRAAVGANGVVGAWTALTPLPSALAFHAVAVATPANSRITAAGFLYVIGGATDAAGTPSAAVYRGALASDGTVSGWTAVTPLPAALHSSGAVVFHGDLYVAGGATTGNLPVATVYRARLDASGGLGAWQQQAPLPFPRAHFGFASFGGFLYAFGGDSGVVAPNSGGLSATSTADVAYARIDLRTSNLTSAGWLSGGNSLTKNVSKHTAVVAGGYVLVTAGLYNGAPSGSSEESYAQLNPDGTISSFHGATGSSTIASLVSGANLFNHAAVGFADANGIFHVLVAGGDDVNAPGTRHRGVFVY